MKCYAGIKLTLDGTHSHTLDEVLLNDQRQNDNGNQGNQRGGSHGADQQCDNRGDHKDGGGVDQILQQRC